jgi:hypothetical protein
MATAVGHGGWNQIIARHGGWILTDVAHGDWSPAAAVRPTAVAHERQPMQPPWATAVGWFFIFVNDLKTRKLCVSTSYETL